MLSTSRVWFPLRSNISFFETTGPRLDLEARVKQMALLADELWFEPGMVDVAVTEDGLWSFWTPPDRLSEEDVRRRREASKKGEPIVLAIAPQEGPGIPADPSQARALISGPLARGFIAEYHLLLNDSGLGNAEWVKMPYLTRDGAAEAKEITETEKRADRYVPGTPELAPEKFLDDRMKDDLNRDLAHGAVMEVPVAIDQLHQPMLDFKASREESRFGTKTAPGARALHLWAPNFTTLSWERIIELHHHDAIGAFRAKLVEAEETVAELDEDERELALKDIGYQELLRKVRELMPTWGGLAAEAGAGALVDLLPYGGLVYAGVTGVAKMQKERTEWTAVLLALNENGGAPSGQTER